MLAPGPGSGMPVGLETSVTPEAGGFAMLCTTVFVASMVLVLVRTSTFTVYVPAGDVEGSVKMGVGNPGPGDHESSAAVDGEEVLGHCPYGRGEASPGTEPPSPGWTGW